MLIKFRKIGVIIGAFAIIFLAGTSVANAADPSSCIVTIARIELKDDAGHWLTVVEPDHESDLVNEPAGFSFFNNGRVPVGRYVNFRLTLLGSVKVTADVGAQFDAQAASQKGIEIEGVEDFKKPFDIKRNDFIGVWFDLDLKGTLSDDPAHPVFTPPASVSHATVQTGPTERIIDGASIRIVYNK